VSTIQYEYSLPLSDTSTVDQTPEMEEPTAMEEHSGYDSVQLEIQEANKRYIWQTFVVPKHWSLLFSAEPCPKCCSSIAKFGCCHNNYVHCLSSACNASVLVQII